MYNNLDWLITKVKALTKKVEEQKMFTATYGTATYAEIVSAVGAGKKVQAVRTDSTGTYIYDLTYLDEHSALFGQLTTSQLYTCSCSSGNAWNRANVAINTLAKVVDVVALDMGVEHAGEYLVVGEDGKVTTIAPEA